MLKFDSTFWCELEIYGEKNYEEVSLIYGAATLVALGFWSYVRSFLKDDYGYVSSELKREWTELISWNM